ncbi:MAG: hypothetical protein ACYC6Y_30160, partial [Thermoguttaceae bacterium]
WSGVDVGPGHAGATAGYDAPQGIARTESQVGTVNVGRGLAVGFGPNGLTVSHSIGVSGQQGVGAAHNFNMSIGRDGTHVSQGGTYTVGGNTRVLAGGETYIGSGQVGGGSYTGGYGFDTQSWSRSQTRRFW